METYNKQTSPAAYAESQSKEKLQTEERSCCCYYCEDKRQQDDQALGHPLSFQDRRILKDWYSTGAPKSWNDPRTTQWCGNIE